ncbi:MAG: deoxyhypusine synthase [candidate division Zixibacteria bacterium]|nr:deoxyhypusine synthase [candidate division Zixibacteria bacterium]
MKKYLHSPTRPFEVRSDSRADDVVERMGKISFQGRNLSTALSIWKEMLKEDMVIFLGLAGAMIPGGLRKILVYLIENRLIDCLVSTGANLFHDCHESLGRVHWKGTHQVNDVELKKAGIDRIYDTFALEKEFRKTDSYIRDFAYDLDLTRPYGTREFLFLLGERLSKEMKKEGILTSAYKAKVPIYCPAISDSSIGIALATHYKRNRFLFDVIKDVEEMALIVLRSKATGVIYVGGGTPKNFIQQAEITASIMKNAEVPGHKYAIQITTDAPQWGNLSGCTFQEAQSWGKIHKKARTVTVYCDATIVLPFLVTALAQTLGNSFKRQRMKVDKIYPWK